MKCKKTLALVLAGTMLLPSGAFAADISQFSDFPNDWSAQPLKKAVDNGLLNGSNGQIKAKGLLTRAQMAAIVSRAFGATKTASLSGYKDILPEAWYYNAMGTAVQMKTFQGSDGLLKPDEPITREEAFTVLARAFALTGGSSSSLSSFSDNGSVSSWAADSVSALVENGYVNGSNGRLNPKSNITRAEFAKIITDMASSFAGSQSMTNQTVEGNLIVRENGASLSGVTVNGDLIIADGANSVSLDGVKVTGRILVRGGTTQTTLKDCTAGKGVTVSSPNGTAAVSVSGGNVGTVTAKSDLSLSGKVDSVVIAEKAGLTVQSGASVGTVTVSAAGATVSGSGTVTSVKANANNVSVSTKNTKVTAASGVSGVKAGDKTVSAGKTETVGTTTSSGGSSSGGSSSGGGSSQSQYSYVLMNIPYGEFYKAELENNDVTVDAVSSATKNKTRTGSLVGGSYHVNADGTDISGIIYPVRIKNSDLSGLTQIKDSDSVSITVTNRGSTTTTEYTGKDALFQSANHSYYVLSDTPSYYKEATLTDGKLSFGAVQGSAAQTSDATAELLTSSQYGDYQINVENLDLADDTVVYGVSLSAVDSDGNTTSYGLRHLENIWLKYSLAFSTGITTTTHGNTLSSAHYESIMGKTINKITYYTSAGTYEIATDLKVPVKSKETSVTVPETDFSAGETTAEVTLPSDFEPEYSVTVDGKESDFFKYDADSKKITWNKDGDAPSGTYQLVITDKGGKYAPITAQLSLNVYAYAAVPYDEYWKSEGVYLSGNDWAASSDESDYDYNYSGVMLKEHDKGAFDAVSRATARHGIHRGSYQQVMSFHTQEGVDLEVAYWVSGTELVLKSGEHVTFKSTTPATDSDPVATITMADGTVYHMTGSTMTGIKYIPVKVNASDFADFAQAYEVTKNGEELTGGYTERQLIGFTGIYADVNANTNGLKEVTKGRNGSFTFGARKTGSDSGIQDTALKTVDESNITITPQKFSGGTYGAMFRVHLTGSAYGDLGSRMQSVTWKYYGDGDTVLATYGTKFAADIWMHGSNGIQLGLTDSLRGKLPEGTDGTGKWEGTIHALGYEDYTFTVNLTEENVKDTTAEAMTPEQKTQLTKLKDVAGELLEKQDDSEYSSVSDKAWSDLTEHYNEAVALLANADATTTEAEELLGELPGMIAPVKLAPVKANYTALFPVLTDSKYDDYWTEQVAAKLGKSTTDSEVTSTVEYLKTVCAGKIHGEDAVKEYGDLSNGFQFQCDFKGDFDNVEFDGNTIKGTKDGTEVFSHKYNYVGEVAVSSGEMGFTADLYKTDDKDAGEFTYFIMCADTPAETYHIEFRYGSDLDALKQYITGDYAFWLAAGIPVGSADYFVHQCIDLFVDENVEEPEAPEAPAVSGMELTESIFGSYYLMSFDESDLTALDAYLSAISEITVNGEECNYYSGYTFQTGSYGKDAIKFKESNFDKDGTYEIVIKANGYQDLAYTYTKGNGGSDTPVTPVTETKTATLAMIQDQTAAGASKKYRGDDYNITVTVTLSDGKITDVSATSTAGEDDVEYFESLTDKFYAAFKGISANDTDAISKVDAVSGATYSSATVKQAVKNALSK